MNRLQHYNTDLFWGQCSRWRQSMLPKPSPSSSVLGRCRQSVSGRNSAVMPPRQEKEPMITSGRILLMVPCSQETMVRNVNEILRNFTIFTSYSLYYLVIYSEHTEHVQYTFSKNCENRKLQRNFVATPLEMVKLSRVEDIIYTVLELVIGCCVIMVTLAPFPFFFILQLY